MGSNESMQNLLRLAFGGAQQGLERFQQQQDQGVNLAVTLQQMLQRQQQADRQFGAQQEQFAFTKDQAAQAAKERGVERRMNWGQYQMSQWLAQKKQQSADKLSSARARAYDALSGARGATARKADKIPASVYNQFVGSYDKLTKQYNEGMSRYQMAKGLMPEGVARTLQPPTPPPSLEEYIKQQTGLYNATVEGREIDASGASDETIGVLYNMLFGGQ
jgi:hypothetical protein